MKFEPPVDHARLAAAIRREYGIELASLAFIPVGWASACFRLDAADGARYLLKVWVEGRQIVTDRANVGRPLLLVRELYDRRLFTAVAAPLFTGSNGLLASVPEGPMAVFPFVEGRHPELRVVDELEQLGTTIAAIHAATSGVTPALLPQETFDIPFEAELVKHLAEDQPRATGAANDALHVVSLRRDEIALQLERLHRFRQELLADPGQPVLCHTDIWSENLLLEDNGTLIVLDWDDARLAPAEFDLQCAVEGGLDVVLAAYGRAGGDRAGLSLHRFAFYLLRRYLEDMAVRHAQIVGFRLSDEEVADNLAGIEDHGFAQCARLEERVATVNLALQRLAPQVPCSSSRPWRRPG